MKGDTDAQAILGHLYYKENNYRTYDEAAQWLLKAAEGGHRQAQETLGIKYSTGDRVPKSLAKAEYWLQKAADQGSNSAKQSLAKLRSDQ
jgi:TPR repeat protein